MREAKLTDGRCNALAVFGEATLDDLDDDPELELHKHQCRFECEPA